MVEEGSVKAWLTVVGTIYAGIASYGSFRSGIDYLAEDSKDFSEYVLKTFKSEAKLPKETYYRTERRLCTPGKIQRLYKAIDSKQGSINKEAIHLKTKQIITELDSPQDRKYFLNEIPQEIIGGFPEPLPKRDNYIQEIYAISRESELRSIKKESKILTELTTPPKLPWLK
ncbi:MAG: hypothetical protein Q9M92_05570 [Enterobacterales bacterium]|nr:hypothetical protein [Enterobacterales bacterium]